MNAPGGSRISRTGKPGARELAHGTIGPARVTAFGVSNVAPAGAVAGGLVIVLAYAGFAAPLVVLIALVASLTGWMMVFAYALQVPAGIALTSEYASQLLVGPLHVTIAGWALFVVILAAVAGVAQLGIGTSSWVDLALAAGEVAVIAGLAITVLAKTGPAHYSPAVLSPASSPNGQLTDITNATSSGSGVTCSYRRRPPHSSCFPSGESCTHTAGPWQTC